MLIKTRECLSGTGFIHNAKWTDTIDPHCNVVPVVVALFQARFPGLDIGDLRWTSPLTGGGVFLQWHSDSTIGSNASVLPNGEVHFEVVYSTDLVEHDEHVHAFRDVVNHNVEFAL